MIFSLKYETYKLTINPVFLTTLSFWSINSNYIQLNLAKAFSIYSIN